MALAQIKRPESSASEVEDMTFLYYLGNGEDGPVEKGHWGFLGEHDVGTGAAASA